MIGIALSRMKLAAAVGLACLAWLTHPASAAEVRVIVLPFEPSAGISQNQANELSDQCARLLDRMGLYQVVNRSWAAAPLAHASFDATRHASIEEAARAAGTLLKAHYVIAGSVAREDNTFLLNTWLVRVRSEGLIRQVRTRYSGSFEQFVTRGPLDNLQHLLSSGRPTTPAQPDPRPTPVETARRMSAPVHIPWDKILADTHNPEPHIKIGARWTYLVFTRSKADVNSGFAAKLDEVELNQDYSPIHNAFIAYEFTPAWGFELAWNQISADARGADGRDEGRFRLDGPMLSLVFRLANESRVTPCLGLGAAWFVSDFSDHQENDGQDISIADAPGFSAHLGADVRLWKDLYLDLLLRYMYVEADVRIKGPGSIEHGPCAIPFSHMASGVGLKWAF